jgi:uridine kinase
VKGAYGKAGWNFSKHEGVRNMTQIVEAIRDLSTPAVVAISGFGGSGKSTFAQRLSSAIHAPVIGVDTFCTSTEQVEYRRWEIMDFARMEREVLIPFTSGASSLVFGEFDWEKNIVVDVTTLQAPSVLIVEGVGLFRPTLLPYFSYTIWIDCPLDVAIARGKRRDREEYGVPHDTHWDGIWRDNDVQCYQEFSPMNTADCLVKSME